MLRAGAAAALAVIPLALAACSAGAVDPDPDAPTTGAGMCTPDVPDCIDVAVDPDGDGFDSASARDEARALLGKAEGELAADTRVGRRGEEHMMLTEDYVLGRHTVELDPDADGTFRVTTVITELPEGPEATTSG